MTGVPLPRSSRWVRAGFVVLDVFFTSLVGTTMLGRLLDAALPVPVRVVAAVTGVVMVAALWARRFRPVWAMLAGIVAVGVNVAVVPPVPVDDQWSGIVLESGSGHLVFVLAVLLFAVTVALPWRRSVLFLAGVSASTLWGPVVGMPHGYDLGSWVTRSTSVGIFVLLYVIALGVRRQRVLVRQVADYAGELERRQGDLARAAVAEERLRISRELHDAVAHHVTVMTIQVAAAEAALDSDADEARSALSTARAAGESALGDMRDLVGALRAPDGDADLAEGSVRTSDAFARCLDSLGDSGVSVRLVETGRRRELPHIVDRAAVRIVQEALTNVLRHSGTSSATVDVVWGGRQLRLLVRDHGAAGRTGAAAGGDGERAAGAGLGLIGMRERAAAAGGTLTAGPHRGGGFEVAAVLPLTGRATAGEGQPAEAAASGQPRQPVEDLVEAR